MAKWIQTKHVGVRYREHPTRKYGVRKDRYYVIRYYVRGERGVERKVEPLGWESAWKAGNPTQTISLEQEAVTRRAELMQNQKTGKGPVTLKDKRAENVTARQAELAKLKADAEAQKTLSEYWEQSYFPAAKLAKQKNSWEKEEQYFRLRISPLLGDLPLKDIKLEQWDELVKTLAAANQSLRSREYIIGTLRRIMKHAYERRLVSEAPPTGKRIGIPGPGNNRRQRFIEAHEEAAILGYLAKVDLFAWRMTRFAFLTGCRASEAFNLTWAAVSGDKITFNDTKNKDSREIPLSPPLAELFESIPRGAPDEYVFMKTNGEPYTQAPMAFQTAVEKLGLNEGRKAKDKAKDRIVFHSIRHSVATRLAKRLTVRDLMEVMGWRTVQMAIRYVHGNDDAKKAALSMLGGAPADNVLPFRTAESTT